MLTGVTREYPLVHANQQKVARLSPNNRQPLLNGQGRSDDYYTESPGESMTQIIRAKSNTKGSNIKTFHRIAEDKVEVMEFIVHESSKITHTPLKDLNIKDEVLFAYIVRGTHVIFPRGNDEIKPRDRVIIATTIPFIEDLDEVLNSGGEK